MTPPPDTFIFDLDGVLCDYDLDVRLERLSRLSGVASGEIRSRLWDSGFEDAADAGEWPDGESYLAEFGRRLGFALTRQQWVEARRASMTPWPAMLDLVERLKASGHIALLTNNVPLLAETLPEVFPPVPRLFGKDVFCSSGMKMAKPDPQIYREVCRRMACLPSHAVFVDDKPENAEGAEKAGLFGIRFTGEEALEAEFERLGIRW